MLFTKLFLAGLLVVVLVTCGALLWGCIILLYKLLRDWDEV